VRSTFAAEYDFLFKVPILLARELVLSFQTMAYLIVGAEYRPQGFQALSLSSPEATTALFEKKFLSTTA
jgi:hypothetical protein